MTSPTTASTADPWRDGHQTARALRDALARLGIPPTVLDTLTVRTDASGGARIVLPPLPVADADRLLSALGPAIGPPWIGRRDAPPVPAGELA